MEIFLHHIKNLSTIYIYLIILVSSLFSIIFDSKSLRLKRLYKEARICKGMGYMLLALGTIFFFAAKYL